MTSRSYNAIRNIVFGILLKTYQIIVPFLLRTVMIYCMGVEYLGLNSLFTSILQVLNLAELGVGSAMTYSMYKPIAENDQDTLNGLLGLYRRYYTYIGCFIAIIGILITPFVPKFISGTVPINIYVVYLLNLFATASSYWLFAYRISLLQAYQRNDIISKITLIISTVQYLAQAVVLWKLHNYYVYILIMLVSQLLINIAIAIASKAYYPNCKPIGKVPTQMIKDVNTKVKDLFFTKIGSIVVDSVDTIVISSFLGLSTLAIYQNYFFIMNSIYGLVAVILGSVTAGIGNSLVLEDSEKNYRDLRKLTFIISWIICVCCCCFLGLYQPFMKLWVGNELMLDFKFVILLCIYFYVRQMGLLWATIKDAAGLWHNDRFRGIIAAFINLLLNLLLVNYIGLYGVLLSTIISVMVVSCPWLLHNIFLFMFKKKFFDYFKQLLKYMLLTISICVICIVVLTQYERIELSNLVRLILNGLTCLFLSNFIGYIVLKRTDEFNDTKMLIIRSIRERREN